MAHQDLYKSQGDEIFQHLERNANLYLQTQNKHIQCQDNLTPQLITPKIPEISSLKEINLVNSLAETGNGQICSVKLICQKCKKFKLNSAEEQEKAHTQFHVSYFYVLLEFCVQPVYLAIWMIARISFIFVQIAIIQMDQRHTNF